MSSVTVQKTYRREALHATFSKMKTFLVFI
jgi:hypothetical protein